MTAAKECCNHDCNQGDDCPIRAFYDYQRRAQAATATPLNTANSDGTSRHQRGTQPVDPFLVWIGLLEKTRRRLWAALWIGVVAMVTPLLYQLWLLNRH